MSLHYWERSNGLKMLENVTEIVVGNYPNGENIGTISLQEDDGKWAIVSGYDRKPDGRMYGLRRGFESKQTVIEYAMECYVLSMRAALQEAEKAQIEFRQSPDSMSAYTEKWGGSHGGTAPQDEGQG